MHDADFAQLKAGISAYCEAHHDFSFKPNNPIVRLHEPTFGADEIAAVLEVMLSTQVTMGPKVKAFERAFADSGGWPHGVMVNSGSSANLLVVAALVNPDLPDRLHPGDEVIVPALSWSTTVWPLVQHGLIPVLVDIDPRTLNIDPGEVERAIGPRTRAVMPVHVYGNPCDMDALTDICRRRNLLLIEDCCEALGASYGGRPVGGFGAVGTFSFYFSHHIATMEGGICVTEDTRLAELMRILRAHGWVRETEHPSTWTDQYPDIPSRFLFVNSGYNLRPMEVSGAMGTLQLPKLAGFVEKRRHNADWFSKRFARYGDFFSLQQETKGGKHSWFGLPVRITRKAPFDRAALTGWFEERMIETRPIICGNIARQPAMRLYHHRTVGDLAHADEVMRASFSFGIHQHIDEGARSHVANALDSFVARHAGA